MARARPFRPASSPLRGPYLVQNPFWGTWLRVNDTLLRMFSRQRERETSPTPNRVLVCVGGHLGDAIIATSALSQLNRAAPTMGIGVLSGSWNREILESLPYVRWFHSVDHWKTARKTASLPTRWVDYRRSRARALRDIREISYDAAVDLYAYYPNFATTIAAARIPVRIGYGTGGFGPMYTREVHWNAGRPVTDDHRVLMESLLPGAPWSSGGAYDLSATSSAVADRVAARLGSLGVERKRYAVLHVGGGASLKEWPLEHWVAVARELLRLDIPVVLTGAGRSDAANARAIHDAVAGTINLCDELPWPEFRCVVALAALVLSADTVAMHLAAAEGTPCVAVRTGIDTPNRWDPAAASVRVLTHPVSCAPCYRSRGCSEMLCVRGVEPALMLESAEPFLPRAPR